MKAAAAAFSRWRTGWSGSTLQRCSAQSFGVDNIRFRTEGASERATRELKQATETNPYVPLYLLGRKNFLAQGLSELVGLGDESEAVSYFATALSEWLKTPGAVEWVRENTEEEILSSLEQE